MLEVGVVGSVSADFSGFFGHIQAQRLPLHVSDI
jgi:hypothetical protein